LRHSFDGVLVDELLVAYMEAKRNFYLGGHRLSAVEGGRFCEAAFRMLEQATNGGSFTPIGQLLDTDQVIRRLERLPASGFPKSLRIYLPRALRIVYDIRNSRDAAHLADGIDPNLQDATLVVSILDWVLAEFIRICAGVTPENAQILVEGVVTRLVPVIQEFASSPRVLKPDLRASDVVLVLLYRFGSNGVPRAKLAQWVSPSMRKNLGRTVRILNEKALVHEDKDRVCITYVGQKAVEERGLLEPV
jgi:hypothetical protein